MKETLDDKQEDCVISIKDVVLPQASLSTMNERRFFSYEDSGESVEGMISVYDCWMKEYEFNAYCYEATLIHHVTPKNNLYFEVKNTVYSFICPLYSRVKKAKGRIAQTLLSKGVLVDEGDLSLSFHDKLLEDEESLQSYGVNSTDTLEVTITKQKEFPSDPLIVNDNGFYKREVTFLTESDIDKFITLVSSNALFLVTHLTITFGSPTFFDLSTDLTQLLSMLKSSYLPNVIVLSLIYNTYEMEESWSVCFLSSSFPCLKRVMVYVMNEDGYMMKKDESLVKKDIEDAINRQPSVLKISKPHDMKINGVHCVITPSATQYRKTLSLTITGIRDHYYDMSEKGTTTNVSSCGRSFPMVLDYTMKYEQLIPIVIRVSWYDCLLRIELCSLRFMPNSSEYRLQSYRKVANKRRMYN